MSEVTRCQPGASGVRPAYPRKIHETANDSCSANPRPAPQSGSALRSLPRAQLLLLTSLTAKQGRDKHSVPGPDPGSAGMGMERVRERCCNPCPLPDLGLLWKKIIY